MVAVVSLLRQDLLVLLPGARTRTVYVLVTEELPCATREPWDTQCESRTTTLPKSGCTAFGRNALS